MIICEVGLNHMGSVKYANEYVDKIIKTRADGIIFHIRESSFYKNNKKKFLLPDNFYLNAIKKMHANNQKFGISISDPTKINFCEKIGVDFYKIFAKDIMNKELLTKIIKTKKKTFVSTGMSDLYEIKKFVNLIKNNKKKFTLIHTQLDYDIHVTNLKAIHLLKNKFNMSVAYGNHASNPNVLYLALAFEPTDLLFYVKGNKIKKHIDEPHAVSLAALNETIQNLKELPKSIGKEIKLKMNNRT